MKIREAMSKDIKKISPEATVKETMQEFFNIKRTGFLVIDKENKLVGVVTEKDILRSILPSYLKSVGRFIYEENPKGIKNKIEELFKLKVKDIMFKDVVSVKDDATLCEAAHIMVTQGIRQLPVVNERGIVVGVIGRNEVLKKLIELDAGI